MPGIFADNPEYALTPDDFALRANLFYGWPDFHDKSLHRFPRQHKNTAGTGSLNYPLLLKKVKEYKPYVHCTLENTVPENAVATREFMERTYAEV